MGEITLIDIPSMEWKHRKAVYRHLRNTGIKHRKVAKRVQIKDAHGMSDYSRVQKINHYKAEEVKSLFSSLKDDTGLLGFAKGKILEYLQ